jgi:hypothetical protein
VEVGALVSDTITGVLIGSGMGILGVLLGVIAGHWLEQSSKKKRDLEVAKVELYERLFEIYALVSFLSAVGVTLPAGTESEMRNYRDTIMADCKVVMNLMLRNKIRQNSSILRLLSEVQLRQYNSQVEKGLESVLGELEKGIKNQQFIKARKAFLEEENESVNRLLERISIKPR